MFCENKLNDAMFSFHSTRKYLDKKILFCDITGMQSFVQNKYVFILFRVEIHVFLFYCYYIII